MNMLQEKKKKKKMRQINCDAPRHNTHVNLFQSINIHIYFHTLR